MTIGNQGNFKLGLLAAVGCNVFWGIMPIFWKMLLPIDSTVIIFYRIVLVAISAFLICLTSYSASSILKRLKDIKFMKIPFLAGILITLNWSIYIWAVNAGMIIDTSIGYYIEPLLVAGLGILIFKEKLTVYKIIAIALAAVGVSVIIIYYFELPFVALSLAITFAVYAVMKKKYAISPVLSLFYETIFLTPIAIVIIIYLECTGQGAIESGASAFQFVMLLFAGVATMIPLGLFSYAAMNIPLISVGLIGYFSPTLSMIIGIFIYGEIFSYVEAISFGIIWIGLAIFTIGQFKEIASKTKKIV